MSLSGSRAPFSAVFMKSPAEIACRMGPKSLELGMQGLRRLRFEVWMRFGENGWRLAQVLDRHRHNVLRIRRHMSGPSVARQRKRFGSPSRSARDLRARHEMSRFAKVSVFLARLLFRGLLLNRGRADDGGRPRAGLAPAGTTASKPVVTVTKESRVNIDADNQSLNALLGAMAEKGLFRLSGRGGGNEPLTFHLSNLTVQEALSKVLRATTTS